MSLDLGPLHVAGEQLPPAKFIKALAVLAKHLPVALGEEVHADNPRRYSVRPAEQWKKSCVLTSLTIRDFLFRIGFRDAEVMPVAFVIRALDREGKEIHSLGIGDPFLKNGGRSENGWHGHMIVRVPSAGYLVDATLWPAKRPAWPDLPSMMAAQLLDEEDPRPILGLNPLAAFGAVTEAGHDLNIVWLDHSKNRHWRDAPDYQRRRYWRAAAGRLVAAFGEWED